MATGDFDHMGLAFHGKKLCWAWKGGYGRQLPETLKRLIVHAWNPLACRIWGHDWMPDFATADRVEHGETYIEHYGIKTEVCTDCSAERPCRIEWRNPPVKERANDDR